MKIVSIIGSPRRNGNTYRMVGLIEKQMLELDRNIEFEYIQLSEMNFNTCKGCHICLSKGEDKCPLKDERKSLESKMKQADGVIFASPVYTYNISWIMKNFMDRFAYRCHRPEFHGKKAMVVVTTGAVGISFVTMLMSLMLGSMGFITCTKAGVIYSPPHEKDENRYNKEIRLLNKKTKVFYHNLLNTKPVKPSVIKLLSFTKQKVAFGKSPKDQADYIYWKEKGWLEKNSEYFYNVHIGKIKKIVVALLSKLPI